MKKLLTFTALGTILLVSQANAAGFHLREQSAAAQGNAFAGATAAAENVSYTYYNAAGLTKHKGTNVSVGATYVSPEASASNVKNSAGDPQMNIDNIVHAAWVPSGAFSYQLDEKTFIGVSQNTPFGMVTKYDNNWAGASHGVTSKVMTSTTTPMIAYKATDKLSVGAGLPIQYVKARLTNGVVNPLNGAKLGSAALEGDTVDVGYQLSAMYEFNDDTRLGVNYRSEINHKLKGDITSNVPPLTGMSGLLNQDISARLDTPAMLSVGGFHKLNDKWELMAEYQRVFWSSFESLDIRGDSFNQPAGPAAGFISKTKENWRDTNFYAIGASYKIDSQWKWRLGVAYDESAVKKADRTPRIPDSDRMWYSTGLSYQYTENLSFDMSYTYIDAKKASVDTALTGNSNGAGNASADYSNSVQLWGLGLNYKF